MSYPFLSDLLRDWFGVDLWLPIPMFGFFVGVAFFCATYLAKKEVIRRAECGVNFFESLVIKQDLAKQTLLNLIDRMSMIALISGMFGARLFHILEYPQQFLNDPFSSIFSRGGFTIFGGMIIGTLASVWFLKKQNVKVWAFADAIAPSLILGYAIGRIGCQVSGDGDWGIISDLALKPDWLPQWFWAQTYTNNIVGETILYPGVYPTPLYESFMAFGIFLVLWNMRKLINKDGWLFSLYVLLSGLERIFIEGIRVNSKYNVLGLEFTQAQFISVLMIIFGLFGVVNLTYLPRKLKVSLLLSSFAIVAMGCVSKII